MFFAALLCAALLTLLAGMIFLHWRTQTAQQEDSQIKQLEQVLDSVPATIAPTKAIPAPRRNGCQALTARNADFFGWLRVEDTDFSYPIMHTPDDPQKYLRLSFDGTDQISGTPFLDHRCTKDSTNLLIYGHNMTDGTVFGALEAYREEAYYRAHPLLRLDTIDATKEYKIVSVLVIQLDSDFDYAGFIESQTAQDYAAYLRQAQDYSLYDTAPPASDGQLLTLSTCEYSAQDSRLLVIAQETSPTIKKKLECME